MRNIIHAALSEYESDLEQILETHLHQADRLLLDELLNKQDTFQRYELTFIKRIPQSMRPSVIKVRVELFVRFKAMVVRLNPLIKKLNLSDATIRIMPSMSWITEAPTWPDGVRTNTYF
jgi:hypothetical protein